MFCGSCKKSISGDGDKVTCGKCKAELHYTCAGLTKTSWKAKTVKYRSEWECLKCRPISKTCTESVELTDEEIESDDPTYIALKKLLDKMFLRQENKIASRVDSIIEMISKLEATMTNIIDRVKEMEEESVKLKNQMRDLKMEMEMEKQYGRSRNFIVTSIPQDDKEDVPVKITGLLQAMNIELRKEDITAHRLPSTHSPAPIIVQCTTRAIRDTVVRSARKFRPSTKLIGNSHPERAIYFNDHLTPYFSELMKQTKEVKDRLGFKYIWLNGNRIMLKKDNQSKAFRILTESDLEKVG
ncbi:hypothetical protein J6590_035725 [Homalodisca vitripennis]|nr:hypothetical protein J6590_035725 [Homalodisca vitripennis]